eukprot:3926288-Amphidinium_carterae.1
MLRVFMFPTFVIWIVLNWLELQQHTCRLYLQDRSEAQVLTASLKRLLTTCVPTFQAGNIGAVPTLSNSWSLLSAPTKAYGCSCMISSLQQCTASFEETPLAFKPEVSLTQPCLVPK